MDKIDKDLWFRAKIFGWGWGFPLRWEGWVVYMLYILIVFFPLLIPEIRSNIKQSETHAFSYFLYSLVPTVLLVFICFKKGEKPRWRWGK